MFVLAPLLFLAGGLPNIHQISTYGSFSAGHYDGVTAIGELLKRGDFGVGTFNGLDGEMVVLDGRIHRVSGFGDVTKPSLGTRSPFAFVADFKPDFMLNTALSSSDVKSTIDRAVPDAETIVAIRIDGHFDGMNTRSFGVQEKPYQPFADISGRQSVFNLGSPDGTIVGFRMPKSVGSLNVPGYHFHFLTNDRKSGGHVLSYTAVKGTIRLMKLNRIVPIR